MKHVFGFSISMAGKTAVFVLVAKINANGCLNKYLYIYLWSHISCQLLLLTFHLLHVRVLSEECKKDRC